MFKSYNGLSEQLIETPFKNISYTIYNAIEDDGYLYKLKQNKYDEDPDSLECMVFKISDEDKDNIKNNEFVLGKQFKSYIENELQNFGVVGIFIMKKINALVAVKPKGYDIKQLFS